MHDLEHEHQQFQTFRFQNNLNFKDFKKISPDNSPILNILIENIFRLLESNQKLKENQQNLEKQINDLFIQNMTRQNDQSIKELEEIFDIDPDSVYDINKLEGILSDYSDSQTSTEWVRSVRNNL